MGPVKLGVPFRDSVAVLNDIPNSDHILDPVCDNILDFEPHLHTECVPEFHSDWHDVLDGEHHPQ